MTIKLVTAPPPEEEGEASVVTMSLPDKLVVNTAITGYIDIKNIGAVADDLRLLLITKWNGRGYAVDFGVVAVGKTVRGTIPEGLMVMPSVDAVITAHGQHDENGVWVTDDTKVH